MDDIKNTLVNLTKTITKTSGDILKTTKLSMALSNEETGLKSLYEEIGKKVHEIYAYGGSLGKFFDEKYIEINEHEKKITELRQQLDIAKGTRSCPACGKSAPKSSEFCPKCGANMNDKAFTSTSIETPATDYQEFDPVQESIYKTPEDSTQTAPVAEKEVSHTGSAPQAGKKCGVCGEINNENDKFCLYCGRML